MPLTQHTHTLAHKAHGALLVATDSGTGARVGSCALEAAQISDDGVRVPSTDGSATLRPLLTRMIVDPQARRQGIGKQLVSDAAMQAAEWGYDELVCNVQRGNEAARQLYRVCGFDQVNDPPSEDFVSRMSGGRMLFLRKGLHAPVAFGRATRRRRSGAAVMKLPSSVEDALPWDEGTYANVEVEALWEAVVEAYGSEDAASTAVRQVRGQIVCPIFAAPDLVRESRAALAANLGEEEALVIMAKNPCILTCGDGLREADAGEIRRFAELRRVLDAIPPQVLLGTTVGLAAIIFGKIILIKLGYSDPVL